MLWRWVCRMVLRLAVKCRYEVILRAMELANVVYDCYEQDERDEPARDNDEDEATALLLQQILPFAGVDLDDTVASSQHTTDHSADWAQSEGSIPSPQKRTSPPPQPLDWDHDAITSYSSIWTWITSAEQMAAIGIGAVDAFMHSLQGAAGSLDMRL